MRVPWIIGNWSSGLEDNSRFLAWLSTMVAFETTTTKIETTGDRPDDDRARRWSNRERERERDRREFGVSSYRWILMAADRPSGRVNAMHEQLPARTTARIIYQLRRWYIRGITGREMPACSLPIARWFDCHARRIARWLEQPVGRASVNRGVASSKSGSKFRENDFWTVILRVLASALDFLRFQCKVW